MTPSIDEAVRRLRAEIIAPDWRLTAKRVAALEEALASLRQALDGRRDAVSVVVMAENVLRYIKGRPEVASYDLQGFLKEAMARGVSLYEDDTVEPQQDAAAFTVIYKRFQKVRKKVQGGGGGQPVAGPREESIALAAEDGRHGSDPGLSLEVVESPDADSATAAGPEAGLGESLPAAESLADLARELRSLVGEVREQGEILRRLLALAEGGGEQAPGEPDEPLVASSLSDFLQRDPGQPATDGVRRVRFTRREPVLKLVISGVSVVIPASSVTFVESISARRRKAYLQKGQVELKDFCGWFRSGRDRFYGLLGQFTRGEIKKLSLPVMVPRGSGLPDEVDREATIAVGVGNGLWLGVLFCREAAPAGGEVWGLHVARQQDICGTAFWEGGGRLPVLNLIPLLEREGGGL